MIDNNEQILQKLVSIEENFNKRFYTSNWFCYYSPFKRDSFYYYSYHILAILGENFSSIDECSIGNYIPPNEPYRLIENDIIIEFRKTKVNVFQIKKNDNQLCLIKLCKNVDNNTFIAKFIKSKLK